MRHDSFKKQILAFVPLTDSEFESIISKFSQNGYKNKKFILTEGKLSTHIHFIVHGLVRVFYTSDGKEINTYLACDNGFVSSYSSFINQTKSIEAIQCLEDTKTLSISYRDMQRLYQTLPLWEKVGRILAEQNLLCLTDRLLKLQSVPAKEKYLEFLRTSPAKIVQQTPLIHIASFLGMTPESLSRIRKSIS